MNEAQLRLIWKRLYDKTEFKHKLSYIKEKKTIRCSKCNAKDVKPCPVPDPLPKSLPEVAEDVRLWAEKNDTMWRRYLKELRRLCKHAGYEAVLNWITYKATPTDKIRAAIKVWKTLDK